VSISVHVCTIVTFNIHREAAELSPPTLDNIITQTGLIEPSVNTPDPVSNVSNVTGGSGNATPAPHESPPKKKAKTNELSLTDQDIDAFLDQLHS